MAEKPTILVVEDDADCRSVLQDLLELNGYVVRTCADAREAVSEARAATPALMLLDYLMPDADGAWVVQKLREAGGALARVPVVLTTGSNEGRLIADGNAHGRIGARAAIVKITAQPAFGHISIGIRRSLPDFSRSKVGSIRVGIADALDDAEMAFVEK